MCGWSKVKHLHVGTTNWYEGDDNLAGTYVYGNPSDESSAYSVEFVNSVFDMYAFATLDLTSFMIVEKD